MDETDETAASTAAEAPQPVLAATEALCEALAGFDPALHTGEACAVIAQRLAVTMNACDAARIRAAARAAACAAHRDHGHRDAAEWMARTAGTTAARARAELEMAARLDACPTTEAALRAGALSAEQAREIARTEVEVPGSEAALLDVARRHSLRGLKERARRIRLEAMDPDELHARQHAAQRARHWTDAMGMTCGSFALPPEIGIPLVNRWDAETDRLWRQARREGRNEPRERLAAQALVTLLRNGGTGKRNRADVVFVCDLRAWMRGHAHDGEPVHVVGGGPLPVSVIRDLVEHGDPILKTVTHDGVDIHTVSHHGRHRPAHLQTALDLGDPPTFLGVTCSEAGCDRRYGLQWDHHHPLGRGGPTSYQNLRRPLCTPHHTDKTARDRAAGHLDNRRAPPAEPAVAGGVHWGYAQGERLSSGGPLPSSP